jgi:hypothetical protein
MCSRIVVSVAIAGVVLTTGDAGAQAHAHAQAGDTIRLEVGSLQVDGRVCKPHAALARVRIGDPGGPVLREWTNQLTLGDSAGRHVTRWVTRGRQNTGPSAGATWALRQTYDAITLKPYANNWTSSSGAYTRVTIDGNRVRGVRRVANDTTVQTIDTTIHRPGFFAGASDLVPAAVGFREGLVMTAPVWSPTMTRAELRIFTVVGKETVDVEGTRIESLEVEGRGADHSLYRRGICSTNHRTWSTARFRCPTVRSSG